MYAITIPVGYRDWRKLSVASPETFSTACASAWQRYREKLSTTSFVANVATNVQFMVKDRKKCVSTGDWAFALFTDGKPDAEEVRSAASPVTRRPEITACSYHPLRTVVAPSGLRSDRQEFAICLGGIF
jgi:hypothetical protein